jgi:hypothetical protein
VGDAIVSVSKGKTVKAKILKHKLNDMKTVFLSFTWVFLKQLDNFIVAFEKEARRNCEYFFI